MKLEGSRVASTEAASVCGTNSTSSAINFDLDIGRRCLASLGERPSRECDAACGMPASVYAATKLATEIVVAAYVHQYGLTATGKPYLPTELQGTSVFEVPSAAVCGGGSPGPSVKTFDCCPLYTIRIELSGSKQHKHDSGVGHLSWVLWVRA